jgi:hypothetical protein
MFSSRAWREYPQRYRREAVKFAKSGKTYYPPRSIDPATGETESKKVVLPDEGKVVTYTVIRIPPSQWNDMGPYALCLVELTDGTKVMAQMTDVDPNTVKIGMEVRMEFRRVQTEGHAGVLSYAHKAVPKWY